MQNDKRLLRFDYEVSHICLWGFSDLIMRLLRIWLCRFRVLTNQAKKTRVDMFNLIQPTSKFIYTLHSLQFRIKTIQGYLQIYSGRQYEYNCKHKIKAETWICTSCFQHALNFDFQLKTLLSADDFRAYQRKMTEWNLMRNPNFLWCINVGLQMVTVSFVTCTLVHERLYVNVRVS